MTKQPSPKITSPSSPAWWQQASDHRDGPVDKNKLCYRLYYIMSCYIQVPYLTISCYFMLSKYIYIYICLFIYLYSGTKAWEGFWVYSRLGLFESWESLCLPFKPKTCSETLGFRVRKKTEAVKGPLKP